MVKERRKQQFHDGASTSAARAVEIMQVDEEIASTSRLNYQYDALQLLTAHFGINMFLDKRLLRVPQQWNTKHFQTAVCVSRYRTSTLAGVKKKDPRTTIDTCHR
ncbi:hypothetical protein EVAR_56791_1 [Eumeta japonica]|uniref:Uncharacterized protein n=1 Tax=Eumeta variegata TaxID=151549 RepID=A0A4C1Y3Y3_EUMVA|nr:hypothetical protein EVAR_56791_1 [Eumeta japonica]